MAAEVHVVGIGDDGPAGLTPAQAALVKRAAVLCGGERHLAFFPDFAGERLVVKANVAAVVERVRQAADQGQPVVVLASGDPCWHGIGPILAEELGRGRVRIHPAVSSFQLAFARLGIAWQDAVLLSAHGRPLDDVVPRALTAPKVAILTDDEHTPASIAKALIAAGADDRPAVVCEHLGGPAERIVETTLRRLPTETFAPLNILILLPPPTRRPIALGRPEEAFAHARGLITKAEVRAVTLAKLQLAEGDVFWDIGAGCGSVSIEAAELIRRGQVFAIERDPAQIAYIRENRKRFGAGIVQVVAGEAPAALASLPDPDAVLIGGSGGHLIEILDATLPRLRAGRRLVLNLATLEHVAAVLAALGRPGWHCEVSQVAVARSAPIEGLTRLAALNPVFVVTAWRSDQAGAAA